MSPLPDFRICGILLRALEEDLGTRGDVTSETIFPDDDAAFAVIASKDEGVLSGSTLIPRIFSFCDPRIAVELRRSDGDAVRKGSVICEITGPVRGILAGERTALNFLQRLSGIATLTSKYAAAISHTRCRLLDTRKTTPTLRSLEKSAVLHGGGCNHRFGLHDMVLIKDTHVKRAGGIAAALEKVLSNREIKGFRLAVEVEVQSKGEFETAIVYGPDRIMLDNMPVEEMRACVALRNESHNSVELEASGNITIDTISPVAETGVDFISVGALTHSAPALDIHLVIR